MTQGADERIFGLIAVAEDQQAAVRAGIEGLALERMALAKDRVTLMQAAEQLHKTSEELTKVILRAAPQMVEAAGKGTREAIQAALVDVGEDTTRVVTSAAQPTFDRVEDKVKAAMSVQLGLWDTAREIKRRWTWMVACAIAGGVLATAVLAYAAVWWQSRELERLAGQREQLIGEINGLQGQADQARRSGKRPPQGAMSAWLQAQPWAHGPRSLLMLGALVFIPLVVVAIKRGASAGTYFRMPLHAIGLVIAAAVIQATLGWLGLEKGSAGLLTALVALPLMALLLALSWYGPGGEGGDVLKRGAVVQDGRQARRDTLRLKKKHGADVLTLAGLWVPPEDETKHFKLIGTTGSGKSTAIRELMGQALARGDRAVFADPDGGYVARFYDPSRGDVILNPFDPRSAKWNPLLDVDNGYEADLLAKALIPGETEWNGYARTFVAAVIRQCKASKRTDPAELWRLVAVASTDELRELLQGTAAQPFLEPENGRMFGSLRSVASNAIAALQYVNEQRGAGFSVRVWVREGRGALFMPYHAEQIAALKSLIATWARLAIFQTMSLGEQDNRIWLVVDELDALGHIDGLKDALARLRKFGVRCVLGFQSIAQVSTIYGPGEAKTIVENCSSTLILRCSASEGGGTAQFASALIGRREVIRETVTESTAAHAMLDTVQGHSYGEQHVVEDAVMASQIEALPDRSGYLKFASSPVWNRVEFPY